MTGTGPGTVGPDEKVCPFCAEVIRAAAVKCRYCHSDLPAAGVGSPLDLRKNAPGPEAVVAEKGAPQPLVPEPVSLLPAPTIAEPATAGEPLVTTATVVLLVISLVLALGIAGLFLSARPDDLRTAGNGQVTANSYRSAAMSAAAANAGSVLSYGYKTLAADEKKAREVLTPGFAKKYLQVMDKAGPKATTAKLTLKATVMSTALISITPGRAQVLLFVNTITTAAGSKKQQLNQNRVLMTMTRQDGDWVVSNLDAF